VRDDEVCERVLEEEHVPAPLELRGHRHEGGRERRAGWHRHDDDAGPPLGRVDRGAVRCDRSPVMADEHGPLVAAQPVVQRDRVEREGAGLVARVAGRRAGRVPALERRHGAIPSGGEARQQVPPSVRAVREPVEAQRQRAVRARAQVGQLDPVHDRGADLAAARSRRVAHAGHRSGGRCAACDARHRRGRLPTGTGRP